MVSTDYIYQIWAAAKAHQIDQPDEIDAALSTLRSFGQAMSGNPDEQTGVLTHQDETHVWAVCAAPVTAAGKAIAEVALGETELPPGLVYWLAEKFDESGNEVMRLVQTNNAASQESLGQTWLAEQCWAAAGIERIVGEEEGV